MLVIVASLLIALDLNRRAEIGQSIGASEETLRQQVDLETTRQVELRATLAYVESEDHIEAFARNEGGQLLPGEKRVVPLFIEVTPTPLPPPAPTPDPAANVEPWQAWWRLLTDAPQPTR